MIQTHLKTESWCFTRANRAIPGRTTGKLPKRHIDGDQQLFEIFEGIRDTSIKLRSALLASDWNSVGEILKSAHPHRKRLSPHITTPRMDELIDIALANGAIAPKVCGAGGGEPHLLEDEILFSLENCRFTIVFTANGRH
ncbi:MAG: hypothetical protein HC846_02260 [Blastocatellia bacterium]|nr:hypothetical protein [Blastocatellia bacterium]